MGMVSANRTVTFPSPAGSRPISPAFDTASWSWGTTRVTANTALASGSSQQGKARRASVASICVVANTRSTPASSVNVDR